MKLWNPTEAVHSRLLQRFTTDRRDGFSELACRQFEHGHNGNPIEERGENEWRLAVYCVGVIFDCERHAPFWNWRNTLPETVKTVRKGG